MTAWISFLALEVALLSRALPPGLRLILVAGIGIVFDGAPHAVL
jgi:hypothetical protein